MKLLEKGVFSGFLFGRSAGIFVLGGWRREGKFSGISTLWGSAHETRAPTSPKKSHHSIPRGKTKKSPGSHVVV